MAQTGGMTAAERATAGGGGGGVPVTSTDYTTGPVQTTSYTEERRGTVRHGLACNRQRLEPHLPQCPAAALGMHFHAASGAQSRLLQDMPLPCLWGPPPSPHPTSCPLLMPQIPMQYPSTVTVGGRDFGPSPKTGGWVGRGLEGRGQSTVRGATETDRGNRGGNMADSAWVGEGKGGRQGDPTARGTTAALTTSWTMRAMRWYVCCSGRLSR